MKQVKKKLKRESYTLFTLSLSTLSLLFFSYYYLASLSTLLHNALNNNSNNFKNSKAIFFLCNAIVVFLAKDSGLLEPSTAAATTSDFHGEFAGKKENHHVLEKSKLVGQIKEQDLEVEEEKVMELVVVGGGEEKEEEINGVALEIVNGVEEFEEADEGVDELHRRVEEFIKKEWREIRESNRRIH